MPQNEQSVIRKQFRRHFPMEMLLLSAAAGSFIGHLVDTETYSAEVSLSAIVELLMNMGKLTAAGLFFGVPICLVLILLVMLLEYIPGFSVLKTILYLSSWFIGLYLLGKWLWNISLGYDYETSRKLIWYLSLYGFPAMVWTLYRDPWQTGIFRKNKTEQVDILDVDI